MGRGLSSLQVTIMKHAQEHGRILPKDAIELAFENGRISADNGWNIGKAVASQALRRLVKRGLLVRHRAKFVGWQTFYHPPMVEPVERDRWGHTLEERAAERAEYKKRLEAFRERTKNMSEDEIEREALSDLSKSLTAIEGTG
jgi:predicted transcriptional regulator